MPIGPMDRRQALGWLGGAGLWATLVACSSEAGGADPGGAEDESATGTGGSSPTGDADLHLRLWAEATSAEIVSGITTPVWSFGAEVLDGDAGSVTPSGSYLGPTLRFRTGQRVRIDFENRLDEESIVHWHGLVVPQDQDGQPADAVAPGGTYHYLFEVTNEPGTYWYHPHPHGRTGEQVYRGMAGLLIIEAAEGAEDEAATDGMPTGDRDLGLVLQDRTIDGTGQLRYAATMHDTMAGFVGATLVANGRAGYEIEVPPEPHRIRLLNGANSATRHLTLSSGEPLVVVATDGHPLPEVAEVAGLVLTPAQRSDLWLDFSGHEAGTRLELLAADIFVEGGGMGMGMGMGGGGSSGSALGPAQPIATFVVGEGEPVPGTRPTGSGQAPGPDIGEAAGTPKEFVLSTFRAAHWINDTQWEGRSVTGTETVEAGSVEVWDFVNRSPLAHPMHLHGAPFRVVERTWEDDGAAGSWDEIAGGILDGGLRDTVLVWPGQRVRIVARFADHLGYFLYHCHILEHEDAGMMRNYRAVAPGEAPASDS